MNDGSWGKVSRDFFSLLSFFQYTHWLLHTLPLPGLSLASALWNQLTTSLIILPSSTCLSSLIHPQFPSSFLSRSSLPNIHDHTFKMQYLTTFSLLLAAVPLALAEPVPVPSVSVPAYVPGVSKCAGQPVLDSCLATTKAIASACATTDYSCLCDKWTDVMTFVSLFLQPSIHLN